MSNVKRKDSKGRNLRLGESQRKDGRYFPTGKRAANKKRH